MEIRDSKYFKQFSNPASSDLISSWWGISYEQRMENGVKRLEAKEYDAAIIEFNEALKLNSNSAKAYCCLGFAYQEKGVLHQKENQKENALEAYDNSIKAYQSALLKNSNLRPFDIHYSLGFVYDKKRALSKCESDLHFAIAEYEEALKHKVEADLMANAHNNLGNLYEEEESLDKAIMHFKQVINLKVVNFKQVVDFEQDDRTLITTALCHLGYLYNEKKDYDKTANVCQILIKLSVTYYHKWKKIKDQTLIKDAIKLCDKAITFGYKKVSPDFVKLLHKEAIKLKYKIPPSFLPFLKLKQLK